MTRHFLTLLDLSKDELLKIIHRAIELKQMRATGEDYQPFKNKSLAMIFEKSSTRTRVSFEAAVTQFGGNAIFLAPGDSQLCRGEPAEDTARVLSGMVEAIVLRTISHETIETFARYADVPVINGLSDLYHPCQLLADIQTCMEQLGTLEDKTVAWIGDGNNVCHSWINAARLLGFALNISTPEGYEPDDPICKNAGDSVRLMNDPAKAVKDCDIVNTDAWVSMGQEQEKSERNRIFEDYQVDQKLMSSAKRDAIFMHCLPAYRGLEVTEDVIDGPQSVVWQQAHNRLHAQKALLEFLLRQV